jgi:hypothetical protein
MSITATEIQSSRWRHRMSQQFGRRLGWFPLTSGGLGMTLVCLAALRGFGYGRMDLVVFALTVCGLSIVGFTLLMVLLSGVLLRSRIHQLLGNQPTSSLQAEAGFPNESGLALPAWRWLPLMSLQWQVIMPTQVNTRVRFNEQSSQLDEEITPAQRCLVTHVIRRFELRDVLGLCRFSWRVSTPANWQVLPQTGSLRTLPVLRSMDAEDGIPNMAGVPEGDRMDIRRYAPGDSTRDILWRVYARNRHLNVRLPERSVFYTERTLAYLVSGPEDEAAAGVARFVISRGALGSPWIFGADGSDQVASHAAAAMPLIAGSAHAQQYGLDNFLASQGVTSGSGQNLACIVFVPATSGPWLQRLQQTLARYPGPFTIVLAADGLRSERSTEAESPAWLRRLGLLWHKGLQTLVLDKPEELPGVDTRRVAAIMEDLSLRHARVVLVDRLSGQSFDQRLKRV